MNIPHFGLACASAYHVFTREEVGVLIQRQGRQCKANATPGQESTTQRNTMQDHATQDKFGKTGPDGTTQDKANSPNKARQINQQSEIQNKTPSKAGRRQTKTRHTKRKGKTSQDQKRQDKTRQDKKTTHSHYPNRNPNHKPNPNTLTLRAWLWLHRITNLKDKVLTASGFSSRSWNSHSLCPSIYKRDWAVSKTNLDANAKKKT